MKNKNFNGRTTTPNTFGNIETSSTFSFAEDIFAKNFFNKGNFFEFKVTPFTKKAFKEFTNFFIKNVGKFQNKTLKFTFLFQDPDQFQNFSSPFNNFIKAFSAKTPQNFEFSIIQNADNSAFNNSKPEGTGFNFQFGFPNQDFMFSAQASNR